MSEQSKARLEFRFRHPMGNEEVMRRKASNFIAGLTSGRVRDAALIYEYTDREFITGMVIALDMPEYHKVRHLLRPLSQAAEVYLVAKQLPL